MIKFGNDIKRFSRLIKSMVLLKHIYNTGEPSVSDLPKCKNFVVAYGRWSLSRIEPQGTSSKKRSGVWVFCALLGVLCN